MYKTISISNGHISIHALREEGDRISRMVYR